MIAERQEPATAENWMFPPKEGWTVDQVKDLDLPFDWELVDGVIVPKGMAVTWHNHRVEREPDDTPAVHEFWLPREARSFIEAPLHPVHREKLVTEQPYPIEIDLRALTEF